MTSMASIVGLSARYKSMWQRQPFCSLFRALNVLTRDVCKSRVNYSLTATKMAVVPAYNTDYDLWDYRRRNLYRDWDLIDWDMPSWSRISRMRSMPDLSRVTVGKDGFEANVDVHQFKPYEVTVKTVGDTVVVEAKHEKRRDGDNFIGRHLVKRFVLPRGFYPNDVSSSLSSDGILTIKAPPPAAHERIVYVRQTGPSYLSIKN